MSRSLALAMSSSISPMPQDDFRASWKTSRTNSKLAQEKTFSSMLQLSIGDGMKAALGQAIIGVLNGQVSLNEATAPKELHRKIQTICRNGAIGLERVVDKTPILQ